MNTITIPVSSLKSYLNKAMVFVNKTKMGIHPLYSSLLFKEDKIYVNNGETGAVINVPFTVPQPILLLPFDFCSVINAASEDSQVRLDFDLEKMILAVVTSTIKIKVRLSDPKNFTCPEIPADIELHDLDGFYGKLRNAIFTVHEDATLPLLQGIHLNEKTICSTNNKGIWRDKSPNPIKVVIPRVLQENVTSLGVEPNAVGLTDSQIFLIYGDMVVFSSRIAGDDAYPNVNGLFETHLNVTGNSAEVQYDKDALKHRLQSMIDLGADALELKCSNNILSATKFVSSEDETKADICMEVKSSADFESVFVSAELFLNGVQRFPQFVLKEDGKRIVFSDKQYEYCIVRRQATKD